MAFTVDLLRRDFSGPVDPNLRLHPQKLSWSVFGGPDTAELALNGPEETLLDAAGWLRCPVAVRDGQGSPVWWGFVDAVDVTLGRMQARVSLADLANQVTVRYTFLSPDHHLADQSQTAPASDLASRREFGTKALLITREDCDTAFAEQLRDAVLAQRAWPTTTLGQTPAGPVRAILHCVGWFHTLAWQPYENPEGFYANYGPGPGSFAVGSSSSCQLISQKVQIGQPVHLQSVYFMLRNIGGATRSITAELRQNVTGGIPGPVVATSQPVDPSGLDPAYYSWVRFIFSPGIPLTAGYHWIGVNPGGSDGNQYFQMRLDENQSYLPGHLRYYSGNWVVVPSTTNPGGQPDAYFRMICVQDTGEQLSEIAAAGGQFLQNIYSITTGVETSPYRNGGRSCLEEMTSLLQLGAADGRRVLAMVSPERHLRFFRQPDPDQPDHYLDRSGRFTTRQGAPLAPWNPPVGHYAWLTGSNRLNLPWDRRRLPTCFISGADYWPENGRLRIHTLDEEGSASLSGYSAL